MVMRTIDTTYKCIYKIQDSSPVQDSESQSEPSQTPKMGLFVKIVNG